MPEIDLPQSDVKTIYDYGFDKGLQRNLPQSSTGVVYDAISEALNTGQMLTGGNLTLKSLSIGGFVKQVAPGDNIQEAIDAVAREGGGTVQLLAAQYLLDYNIELKDKVSLVGAGRDVTILDFEGRPYAIFIKGLSNDILENAQIKDLTIQNSNNTAGLELDYADYWNVTNVRIFSCNQKGVRIQRSRNFFLLNVLSDTNTGNNVELVSNNTDRSMQRFSLISVIADSSSADGFNFSTGNGTNGIFSFSFVGCHAKNNTGDGFDMPEGSVSSFIGCTANSNTGKGFAISGTDQSLLGCTSFGNTDDGIECTSGTRQRIIACSSYSNGGKDYDIQPGNSAGQRAVLIGNSHLTSITTVPSNEYNIGNQKVISIGNEGFSPITEKSIYTMKNNSGGSLGDGSVVIYDSSDPGESVNTTNSNGDNKVMGVVTDSGNLGNGNYGNILVKGFINELLVTNGTASISVNDYLSTYSHARYAKKAVAGDMVFAIALSAPTTSTASISALIINPRLI